jgi:hypothetical protein
MGEGGYETRTPPHKLKGGGRRGLLPLLHDVHKVPASKHAQAHLSIIPGLHQSDNSPAVGWEHEDACAHGSGAICCLELDLISARTAALDWAGNTSLRPTSSSSLNSCTSCKQITCRCDRWDIIRVQLVPLQLPCPMASQAGHMQSFTQARQQDALEAC